MLGGPGQASSFLVGMADGFDNGGTGALEVKRSMHQRIFSTDAGAYAEQGRMFRARGDVGLERFNEVQAGRIGDGLFHYGAPG
ncbi:hypothetical protein D3C75_1218680 [compost metagenome]